MNASGFPGRDGTIGPDLGWRDGDRMVCRGWRESDAGPPVPVLRVLPEAEHPAPATLERLAHEFALKDILQRSWAVLPLELARDHGRPVLVLEDPGGEPLERLLRGPLPLERCLRLAIGIAGALAGMRQCGLIHKDIRPLNILVGPDGESVRLTGFGIASRMPREQPAAAPAEAIDGTLAYMAPEQTGRMNRSVDARSDLYAFGVTLYRMLTGVLPFTSDDPMELVHCHMARRPPSPADLEPGLPPAVADLVLKLLAKTPEERYQTALGVAADLRRCLDAWQSAGWIERFRPGGRDIPDTLRIPERLYGRDLEVRSLLDAFHRVLARGTPELALVSGYSGIGKSSVVNELHRAIVPSRGLFAAGKFEQHKRDIPYGTLAGALQALVRQLLVKREDELARWRDAIGASLGANARLVMELVPELERVIGPQPPVTPLPPAEAETRFRAILNRFLGVFAKPEHPLVLFLDDLQWLDAATLGFLADAISPPASLCLLAIGAYRSNEVGPGHPLTQMLDRVRATGSAVQEVLLGPLSENDMRRMVSETAGCDEATAEPLARLMHGKTDGNPFFAIHFLTLLWKEGLFAFDAVQGAWRWDIDAIRAEGFTDNVVELMAGKLTRLPAATQDALKRLACLGSAGTTATLSMVCGKPAEAIHAALWPAVQDGLLLRSDSLYRFIHDRVQEAAHALIPRGERAAEYLRIGRLLAAHAPAAEIEAGVFDIVHQLNRGAALLTAPEERRRVAELNLMAGNRARRSAAYASALAYFKAGIAVLDKHCWEQCYALCFALAYQQAECEFLTGNTAAAEWGLSLLSRRAANLADRASVTCLMINLLIAVDRRDSSVQVGLDFLRSLGIGWPAHPGSAEVLQEFDLMWQQIGARAIGELIELPRMTDPASQATLDILTTLLPPALFTDENLFGLVVARMANLSLQYGNSDGSCLAYVWLGLLLGQRFGNYPAALQFGQLGFDLVEQCGLTRFKARVYLDFSHVANPWMQHMRGGPGLARRALAAAEEIGDLTFAAYSGCNLISAMLAAGEPLDTVQREAEDRLQSTVRARFDLVADMITGQLRLILALRGHTQNVASFNGAEFDEAEFERHLAQDPGMAVANGWYWVRKLQGRFLASDPQGAVEAAARMEQYLWTVPSHLEMTEYHFHAALARAACCDAARPEARDRLLAALRAHHTQIEHWATHCPENFVCRAALVAAEIARVEGRELEAERIYEHAIQAARNHGFIYVEALAHELAGQFYFGRGLETSGDAHLRHACACYDLWGAAEKVTQIERRYPRLALADRPRPRSAADPRLQQLDVASVIKASQAVSGEIVLPRLIETVMSVALENAGADRGLLILPRGDRWCIEAAARAGNRKIEVILHSAEMDEATCPEMLLRYVIRTHASVAVNDAAAPHLFAEDPYLSHRQPRSMLAVPIVRHGALAGVLYLENSLASHVFTPGRTALLEVLAGQAAISLENTRLYSDVREREEKIRRLVDSNIIGVIIGKLDGPIAEANDAFLDMIGYSRADLRAGGLRWTDLTPPEWRPAEREAMAQILTTGSCKPHEREYFRKDGSRVPVLFGAALFETPGDGVAFVVDLTERKRAEEERQANLWFLTSMDRVNRAIQSTNDLEQMMSIVLETVLAIFDTDRAWLIYPCDPAAPTWRVVMEHTRPGFPGAFALDADLPVDADVSALFRDATAASGAVRSGFGADDRGLPQFARRFGVQSMITMAIHPRRERPYLFGLHQCTGQRVWTRQEERLFQEIGRRLTDALTSLLVFRDMQNSEARLAQAQRIAHVGHWECDPATLGVQWSDEIYRIFGMTPQEQPIRFGETSRMSLEDHTAVMQALHEALHHGARYDKEFRAIRPDGEVRIVHSLGQVVRDGSGQPRRMFGTMQDITEHRRAESLARQVFESLPDAVCVVGRDYRLRRVNRTYEQSRGMPAEKLLGRHVKDIPGLETMFEQSIKPRLDRCFAGEEGRYTDWSDNALGRRYRVITYSPLRLEARQVEAALLISRDLTEHALAEEALREAQMELAHANRVTTMGQLTASIAHEINQPITAAVTNAHAALRWLGARPPNLAEVRQALGRIVNEGSRAGEIIGRIRGLIRKLPPKNDWLDVTEAILDVITLTRGELLRNNVTLQTDLAQGLPAIRGDRVQLQQVLLNLIVNAIGAMRDVAENARGLWITAAHEAEGVMVAVRDSGMGVPPGDVSRLFEAFFTTKSGGMGMGLSICRSIIEAHGGRIWVTGIPQGAVFQFVLPIHDEPAG